MFGNHSQTLRRLFSKRVLYAVIGLTIAGFTGAFFQDVYGWLRSGPGFEPYVAVVVSKESIDFPIPEEFLRGFQDAAPAGQTYVQAHNGRKVDIRMLEDLGSVDEAARIAHQLVNDPNCILVVGNSNSTLTATTLDIFLSSKDPPPYILPIATANDLITKAKTANHPAVLRMIPDNASQAEVIQRLVALLTKGQRVAIYSDEENPVYSINLSRDIASRIRKKGGRIIVEEMLGPSNSFYTSMNVWKTKHPPEIIVYVGVAHHAQLLIDQLKELALSAPVIFTDGCMVRSLIENVARIRNKSFIVSPVSGTSSKMPTYEPIGGDAYTLVSTILSSSPQCTRSRLREYIGQNKSEIQVLNGLAGEYRFNQEGNNTAMSYKVYEVTGGKLRLVPAL